MLTWLKLAIMQCLCIRPNMGAGVGTFDGLGGDYDENTVKAFEKGLHMEARTRTFIGTLSKPNKVVSKKRAFGEESLDSSTFIWRKKITSGDQLKLTLEEAAEGMPTYGDLAQETGDFLAYKNQNAYVNYIKSPAIQVQGEMAQQRVNTSIMNIPASVRKAAVMYMAEQMEYEAIIALLYGASPSALNATSAGGLGVSLGPGASGIGAGNPLMGMHWYTTDTGFMTYTPTTLSTWNSTVNDGVNGIDAAASDSVTLAQLELIRAQLDTLKFQTGTLNGKEYKAVCLCDPQIPWRIRNLLGTQYQNAEKRGPDNPIFNVNFTIELDDILYVPVPSLLKFRPAYNAVTSYIDIGPGLTSDPRTYTNSETIGLMIYLGAGGLIEGYNGRVQIAKATAPFGPQDGLAIGARQKLAYVRNQWDSKDGRTAQSTCYSVAVAAFYEPGVGTNWA